MVSRVLFLKQHGGGKRRKSTAKLCIIDKTELAGKAYFTTKPVIRLFKKECYNYNNQNEFRRQGLAQGAAAQAKEVSEYP